LLEWPAEDIARIRLNRPEVRNALNRAALAQLESLLDQLARQEPRAVIITGDERSFCSGANVNELKHFGPAEAERWCLDGHRVLQKLESLPCPTIAALSGDAVGGGLELACACDLRYARSDCRVGCPEVRLGLIPGWGGTFRLPALVGPAMAKELILTGKLIDAEEAHRAGLANGVFAKEEFETRVHAVAEQIAANAPTAVRLVKRMLNRVGAERAGAASEEALALARCFSSADWSEGLRAFFEKREPRFRGKSD